MITENLIRDIDAAAEELVTADLGSLQDLGRLINRLQILQQCADDCGCDAFFRPVNAATELIKDAILDDRRDRSWLHGILNETISCLQQLARSADSGSAITFPEELYARMQQPTGSPPCDKTVSRGQPQSGPATDDGLTGTAFLQTFTLPFTLDENMFIDFLNEQNTVLEKAESNILLLEKSYNKDLLDEVRRIFHTMKSESAVFQLIHIARLCHGVEDLLDARPMDFPIDKLLAVIDWLKYAYHCLKTSRTVPDIPASLRDFLQEQTAAPAAHSAAPRDAGSYVLNTELLAASHTPPPPAGTVDSAPTVRDEGLTSFQLAHMDVDLLSDFVSEVQEHIETIDHRLLVLENDPADHENLNAVFRVFHTIKGAAGFLALDEISRLAHATENILDRARKGELELSGGRIDIIFEAVDEMKQLVLAIHNALSTGAASYASCPTLEQLIHRIQAIAAGKPPQATPRTVPETRPHTYAPQLQNPEQTVHEPSQVRPPDPPDRRLPPDVFDQHDHGADDAIHGGAPSAAKIRESIKVDSEKLDKLIDAIGEMVIIESMIRQDSGLASLPSTLLLQNISQMDKITRELQQLAMSLRMIPVKATFQKMARVVRDLAKKSRKKIEFNSSGEDAMLDKSVVDRIGDPLIHLVRNSVDHGIESAPEARTAAGKNATGRIELNAYHKGGNIFIEVKDDGKGLDKNAILRKAIERGLSREGQALNDREIFNFILLPGFSTAQKITDVSGRGVGMDVVKRTIDDLRGNIDILSEPGQGTTFTLRLPLTLAIIDGMLVRIGSERYIIPTLSIVEAVRPDSGSITTLVNRGEMITIRDNIIPLFRLAHLFGVKNSRHNPEDGIVIVVEDSGKMAGILVDELLGQQSIVIKSMGASLKGLAGVSGGSILSDGRVGIIIDVAGIVKLALSGGT